MSNLLKPQYYSNVNSEAKIIDYNAMISEKIAKLQREMENHPISSDDGFVAGLQIEEVEELVSDYDEEEVKVQANKIIEQANEDAMVIINRAKEEADILKQESSEAGREQGYREGKQQAVEEYEQLKAELEAERERLNAEYNRQVANIEPELVSTILKVFESVTYVLKQEDENVLVSLVNDVLMKAEISKEFLIKVSPQDYETLSANREKLYGAVSKKVQIEIVEEPLLEKAQCVIESDSGIYDCSLDVQLKNLARTLKMLSCVDEIEIGDDNARN